MTLKNSEEQGVLFTKKKEFTFKDMLYELKNKIIEKIDDFKTKKRVTIEPT